MLVSDARTPVRYTPPWVNDSDPPVFFLRAGTVIERELFEADLAGRFNARVVYAHELRDAMLSGIKQFAEPDDRDRLMEVALAGLAGRLEIEADKALYTALETQMRENWPPYHALHQRLETRRALIPTLAFMKFCVGWEYVFAVDDLEPLVFARDGIGLVDQDVMRRLDPLMLRSAGNAAYQLLFPSAEQRKNSAPLSKSGGAKATSISPPPKPASTRTAARKGGSSTGRSGGKTRSRSSRKTSGLQ